MNDKLLFAAVDEILCYVWDPIGVSADGTPETRDEYTLYVPEIVDLLKSHEDIQEIASRLDEIETKRMGLAGSGKTLEVAQVLIDKYEYLAERSKTA